MIVLWIVSLVLIGLYTLAVFQTDFEGKEGMGVVKWLIIASLLLVLFVFIFMGVMLWFTN